jgi:hypothetical protein
VAAVAFEVTDEFGEWVSQSCNVPAGVLFGQRSSTENTPAEVSTENTTVQTSQDGAFRGIESRREAM